MKHDIKDQELIENFPKASKICKTCGEEVEHGYIEINGYGTGDPLAWSPISLDGCGSPKSKRF